MLLYMGINLALSSAECQIYRELSKSQAANGCENDPESINRKHERLRGRLRLFLKNKWISGYKIVISVEA